MDPNYMFTCTYYTGSFSSVVQKKLNILYIKDILSDLSLSNVSLKGMGKVIFSSDGSCIFFFKLVVSATISARLLGVLCLGTLKKEEINLKDNILIIASKSDFSCETL